MRARRWWTDGALLLTAATLALGGCGEPPPPVGIGSPAPAFELPVLGGGSLSRDSLAGRPVIVNFWATWCQPCRREFPVLNALNRDPRVEVVAIALDEEGERKVAPFVRREKLEYRVLIGDQETFERFGGYTIPHTLVLDASHTIVGVYRGPASEEELESDLRRIAGEAAAEPAEVAGG